MAKVFIVIEDTDEASIVIGVTTSEAIAEAAVDAIDAESGSDEPSAFYTEAELAESIEEMMQARDRVWKAYLDEMEMLENADSDLQG